MGLLLWVLVVFEDDVGWSDRRTGIGKACYLVCVCVVVVRSSAGAGRRDPASMKRREETTYADSEGRSC